MLNRLIASTVAVMALWYAARETRCQPLYHADASDIFTFGIPRAGLWDFAALDTGSIEKHQG